MSNYKTLVFISSEKGISGLKKNFSELGQDIIVVSGPDVWEGALDDLRGVVDCKAFKDYESGIHNARDCPDEMLRLVKQWGGFEVAEGQTLEGITKYKDICLWMKVVKLLQRFHQRHMMVAVGENDEIGAGRVSMEIKALI